MTDLLTDTERAHAEKCGWQLCHVYDLKTSKWLVEVLPSPTSQVASAHKAQELVLGLARTRDAVAIRALSLVMKSYQTQPKGRKQ